MIINGQRSCSADQATIRTACKFGDRLLHVFGISPTERGQFHPKRRGHRLDGSELTDIRRDRWVSNDADTRNAGRDLLEQLQPFCADAILENWKSSHIAAGLRQTGTKPEATGSATITNTIGRVRVACCSATTDGV